MSQVFFSVLNINGLLHFAFLWWLRALVLFQGDAQGPNACGVYILLTTFTGLLILLKVKLINILAYNFIIYLSYFLLYK